MPTIQIVEPASAAEFESLRALLWQYLAEMRAIYSGTTMMADLDDVTWDRELDALPVRYGAPRGAMLLAHAAGAAAGCVMFREVETAAGEMKRLYVPPAFRGRGLAYELVRRLARLAVARGYGRIVFDVGWRQQAALALYARMGFREIPPYHSCSDWFIAHAKFYSGDAHALAALPPHDLDALEDA